MLNEYLIFGSSLLPFSIFLRIFDGNSYPAVAGFSSTCNKFKRAERAKMKRNTINKTTVQFDNKVGKMPAKIYS